MNNDIKFCGSFSKGKFGMFCDGNWINPDCTCGKDKCKYQTKRIHKVAHFGDRIVLNDCQHWNDNAKVILENKIATAIEEPTLTTVMTDLGEVYHAWYDVIEE